MMHRLTPLAVVLLAACGQPGGGADRPAPGGPVASAAASPAEQACLRDVAARTNNEVVRVDGTRAAAGGTEVTVLVGDDTGVYPPAPWRCVAAPNGTTSDIAFIGGA